MIPAGYILKKVARRPSSIRNKEVQTLFGVSACISENFADYASFWRHNGFWLFNNATDMDEIIAREGIDCSALTLFYYAVYERQFDEVEGTWSKIEIDKAFKTAVAAPRCATIQGYDIVSFSMGTTPECSPLSCNSLAEEISVNQHCLFRTFDEAKAALETGKFDNCEPGPFRIFAVYTVEL